MPDSTNKSPPSKSVFKKVSSTKERELQKPYQYDLLSAHTVKDIRSVVMDELDLGLDEVLPFYCDYLARLDHDGQVVFDAASAVVEVVRSAGASHQIIAKDAELSLADNFLELRTSSRERMLRKTFMYASIKDPVAFVSRNSRATHNRLLVFTEKCAGHYNNNDVYHVFQCYGDGSEPQQLAEQISNKLIEHVSNQLVDRVSSSVRLRDKPGRGRRPSQTSSVSTFTSDSVRSATIRSRPKSTMVFYDHQPANGISGRNSPKPVAVPTPPGTPTRTSSISRNGEQNDLHKMTLDKAAAKKPLPYKFPLVKQKTKELGLENKPAFRYQATDSGMEKSIILLNYCIDDIEKFTAQVNLHSKEFKNEHYQATNFTSVFQKFKLSFNLLAKLDGVLTNPSAIELLHHLFPPLAILLDESHEMFDVDLVKDISSPMMTKKAVDMLASCLQDRELSLWHALGDYWQNPKSAWEGDIMPYQPKFSDGWSPGVIDFSDDEDDDAALVDQSAVFQNGSRQQSPAISNGSRRRRTRNDTVTSESTINGDIVRAPAPVPAPDSYSIGGMSTTEATVRDQEDFRDFLMEKGASIALMTNSWKARDSAQLTASKNEHVEILDDTRNWWSVRNRHGLVGYIPCTFVRKIIYEKPTIKDSAELPMNHTEELIVPIRSSKNIQPVPHQPPETHYKTQEANLSFSSEEEGSSDTTLYEEPPQSPNPPNLRQNSIHSRQRSSVGGPPPTVTSAPPPPPPPPPMPTLAPPLGDPSVQLQEQRMRNRQLSTSSSILGGSTMSVMDEMKTVQEILRQKQKSLDITKTPDVYVNKNSSVSEVATWLKEKKFSSRVRNALNGYDGQRLLSTRRGDLLAAFGEVEGSRLDGQITICKKTTGFGTASSELRDILFKARRRTETMNTESLDHDSTLA